MNHDTKVSINKEEIIRNADLPKMNHIPGFNNTNFDKIMDSIPKIDLNETENMETDLSSFIKSKDFRIHFESDQNLSYPPFTLNPVTYILYQLLYHTKRKENHRKICYNLNIFCIILSIITSVSLLMSISDIYQEIIPLTSIAIANILFLSSNIAVTRYVQISLTKSLFLRSTHSADKIKKLDKLIKELKNKY